MGLSKCSENSPNDGAGAWFSFVREKCFRMTSTQRLGSTTYKLVQTALCGLHSLAPENC